MDAVFDMILSDMDEVTTSEHDPLSVITGCVETVVLHWDELDDAGAA